MAENNGGQESEVGSQTTAVNNTSDVKEMNKWQLIAKLSDGLFIKILTLIIIIGGGWYLFKKANPDQILGYLFGVITTAVGYHYHTSKSSQDKQKQLAELNKTGG